ncbi:hypothetical protein [Arthrobacter sp. AB6]|uniref:8-oxoguanine DNA glycosylase OGG fold protein n=1 Tax=Arthrobacter sp. AB6 TaxID=2962570 RepID=UPI0037BE69CD
MSPNVPPLLVGPLGEEPATQGSFPWIRDKWREHMHDLPDVLRTLDQLPDRVDRQSTRAVVLSELAQGRVLSAFIPAMVWGWGTTGLGPVRTRWALTQIDNRSDDALQLPVDPTVAERLDAGARAVRKDGPLGAFRLMNNAGRIKHLGPSYFTKWLYFSSALQGPDDAAAAPILDKRIVDWLREHADISLDADKSPSYADYLELLTDWGDQYGRTRVQVEKAIFKLATGRG